MDNERFDVADLDNDDDEPDVDVLYASQLHDTLLP
jgi:hypothetical protein